MISSPRLKHTSIFSPETAEKAVSVFEEILSEQLHNRPASELCRKILLEHLIILTMRELPDNAKNTGNTFYMHMLKFLYSHFHESINVSDGARYAGYTPNHFNTLFHIIVVGDRYESSLY